MAQKRDLINWLLDMAQDDMDTVKMSVKVDGGRMVPCGPEERGVNTGFTLFKRKDSKEPDIDRLKASIMDEWNAQVETANAHGFRLWAYKTESNNGRDKLVFISSYYISKEDLDGRLKISSNSEENLASILLNPDIDKDQKAAMAAVYEAKVKTTVHPDLKSFELLTKVADTAVKTSEQMVKRAAFLEEKLANVQENTIAHERARANAAESRIAALEKELREVSKLNDPAAQKMNAAANILNTPGGVVLLNATIDAISEAVSGGDIGKALKEGAEKGLKRALPVTEEKKECKDAKS